MTTSKATDGHSTMSHLATELERAPERVEDARQTIEGWTDDVAKMVKKHPVRMVLGAFAIGYVVAKVVRYL